MTTQTTTFTLPAERLPEAQSVICAWAYMEIGAHLSEELPLREVVDVLETISSLHVLGVPGQPADECDRELDSQKIALLRQVAEDVKSMGLDMAINGYEMDTDEGLASAAFRQRQASQAHSLLEILPAEAE